MGHKASLMLQVEEIRQISEETGFSGQQIEKLYSRFTQLDRANCGSLSKNDLLSIPELAINPLCDRLIEMFFADHGRHDGQEERINFRQFMRVLAAFRTSHLQVTSQTATNGLARDENHKRQSLPPQSPLSASRPKYSVSSDQNLAARNTNHESRRRPGHRSAPRLAWPGHDVTGQHSNRDPNDDQNNSNNNNTSLVESLSDCLKDKLYFLFKIYDADNDGRISFNDLRFILKMMVGNYIEDVQLDKIATRAFVEVDQDNDGFVEFGEFVRVFAGKDMDDKLRVRFF